MGLFLTLPFVSFLLNVKSLNKNLFLFSCVVFLGIYGNFVFFKVFYVASMLMCVCVSVSLYLKESLGKIVCQRFKLR